MSHPKGLLNISQKNYTAEALAKIIAENKQKHKNNLENIYRVIVAEKVTKNIKKERSTQQIKEYAEEVRRYLKKAPVLYKRSVSIGDPRQSLLREICRLGEEVLRSSKLATQDIIAWHDRSPSSLANTIKWLEYSCFSLHERFPEKEKDTVYACQIAGILETIFTAALKKPSLSSKAKQRLNDKIIQVLKNRRRKKTAK